VTDLDAQPVGPAVGRGGADEISVLCRPTAEGFTCEVVVGRDAGATRHGVTVSHAELSRLAPGHYDPEDLVVASFRYLLAREPREAILPRFGLTVIERYFPGYEAELRAVLTGGRDSDRPRDP
jgi:hypothetical protein